MKIYLAARYSRHPEMRGVRDVLAALGYEITSRWIDMHGGKYPSSFTPEILNSDPEYCGRLGVHDMEDVQAADVVISFTDETGGGKGGRHVEHGLALGLGKRVIVCGPRENIFHTLPQVEHYTDWPRLVMALTPADDYRHADAAMDELDIREGSRVLGPEQCCEQGCNGGACESCTCCAAGWCVTGRDGLPEDAEDFAIWLKYASEHNATAKALADALKRAQRGEDAAQHYADKLRRVRTGTDDD